MFRANKQLNTAQKADVSGSITRGCARLHGWPSKRWLRLGRVQRIKRSEIGAIGC
jgi:hypothetical protein